MAQYRRGSGARADARCRRAWLTSGHGAFQPNSQIALRMVAREILDEAAWLRLLDARLRRAIARRKPLLTSENDACRLCFSEADELPGLIADKYGQLVVLQFLTKGLFAAGVRETCVRVLREEFAAEPLLAIVERPDPRIREIEGLPAPETEPLWAAETFRGAEPAGAIPPQRTGLPLRRQRRPEDRRLSRPARQLRCRAGVGDGIWARRAVRWTSFAIRADLRCIWREHARRVTGLDASRAALEVAEQNLAANRGRIGAEVDWIEGDAFAILRDWSGAGEKFDAIVLDPPAFAKTKRAVEGALRGYKELNLRALKMLASWRHAGDLLLLPSRGLGRSGGHGGVGRRRCRTAGAPARTPQRRSRSSRDPQFAGDRVPQVPGAGDRMITLRRHDEPLLFGAKQGSE